MVKFTPTVILPGFHIMGWNKCSAPQRQDTGQNWPSGVTGSLRSIPQVRLILPTRAQPPRTEFNVLVCYIQLYNWKDGYLSVILVQLRRLRKNSQEPTRTDPWFNCQHRWRQPALSGSPSGSWSPTALARFRILRRWATTVMHLDRTGNSFQKIRPWNKMHTPPGNCNAPPRLMGKCPSSSFSEGGRTKALNKLHPLSLPAPPTPQKCILVDAIIRAAAEQI